MSVFTKVSHAELEEFLKRFALGELIGYQGIGEGVENTNFRLEPRDARLAYSTTATLQNVAVGQLTRRAADWGRSRATSTVRVQTPHDSSTGSPCQRLYHGEGGQIEIAAAILSRDASQDIVLCDLTHVLQIAHFDFQIAEASAWTSF